MTVDRTLKSVIDDCHEADRGKWDSLIEPTELRLEDGEVRLPGEISGRRSLMPNDRATSQLCQQLGIPAAYFRRCNSELQDHQFNYWMERLSDDRRRTGKQAPWLLRCQEGTLRAVLSHRYGRLDNAALMDCLERVIDPSLVVESVSISDVSFHLRLLKPNTRRMIVPGDEACAGLHIANSEVGLRSVTVDALVYRLVCTNGLIRTVKGKSLFHRRHIGRSEIDAVKELPAAIEASLVTAEDSLQSFADSTTAAVEDPQGAIEAMVKTQGWSDVLCQSIIEQLSRERPALRSTKFGIVNALTGAARSLSPDQRYDLEVLAGQLI